MRGKPNHYYDGYIPVPLWNGEAWEPADFSGCYPDVTWPEGFDPATLPHPQYALGQIVCFYFGPKLMDGEIRQIKIHGGAYHDSEGSEYEIATKRYLDPKNMQYTIYPNGHGRWVLQSDIIGGTKGE